VGYAGGTKANPTYHSLGDHAESLQIVYNPNIISYETLLRIFWESHNPTLRANSLQYRSIIFFQNPQQEALAIQSKKAREVAIRKVLHTEITPLKDFYPAEDYHQKYYLQNTPQLMDDIAGNYSSFTQFVMSTSAARLNGYAAGYGDSAGLHRHLPQLGLSMQGRKLFKSM
jgi:peptide-methionine (S)-S-oxide reductase